jgi:hypothetical protein
MGQFALINYFYNFFIFIQPDGADVFTVYFHSSSSVFWKLGFMQKNRQAQRPTLGSGFSVQGSKVNANPNCSSLYFSTTLLLRAGRIRKSPHAIYATGPEGLRLGENPEP